MYRKNKQYILLFLNRFLLNHLNFFIINNIYSKLHVFHLTFNIYEILPYYMAILCDIMLFYLLITNPFSFILSTILFTLIRHFSSVSASTITLTTGSVPLSRTKTRPFSPKSVSTSAITALTSGSSCASFYLLQERFSLIEDK